MGTELAGARLERLGPGRYRATVPAGELSLRLSREDIPLGEALDFAARHNANRRFLFVSRLLGRHLPTPPARLRAAAEALAARLRAAGLAGPCLFIGLAETATTLGQAVFRAWTEGGGEGLYLDTTRRRTAGEIAFTFTEAHSHATVHFVHLPTLGSDPESIFTRARTLVMVDDEMTTGRTAGELLAAYERWRGAAVEGHLAVLVRWLAPTPPAGTWQTHALLEGEFDFEPAPSFTPRPLAPAATNAAGLPPAPAGTRHGVTRPQPLAPAATPGGRILVVGAGEFGFLPLRLAEAIEAAGGTAFLQATTRSPVALGGAIGHARTFPALSGEGYTEYLYNVPDDHPYDHVLLCCEGDPPPAGHPIFDVPRLRGQQLS